MRRDDVFVSARKRYNLLTQLNTQRHFFVSYPDHATAMSAVRNLNGMMMKGLRIKVDARPRAS